MLRLPGEGQGDSIDGTGLVLLDLELELHRVSFLLRMTFDGHGSKKGNGCLTRGFVSATDFWLGYL